MPSLTYDRASGRTRSEGHAGRAMTGEYVSCHIFRRHCSPSTVLVHEHHLMNFGLLPLPLSLSLLINSVFNLFPSLLYFLFVVD